MDQQAPVRPRKSPVRSKFDEEVLKRLQAKDPKIKRATVRGVYKDALLKKLREDLSTKRLPKGIDGQALHKLTRWQLIEYVVLVGVNGKTMGHQDLWAIRKSTKHIRSKKAEEPTKPIVEENKS